MLLGLSGWCPQQLSGECDQRNTIDNEQSCIRCRSFGATSRLCSNTRPTDENKHELSSGTTYTHRRSGKQISGIIQRARLPERLTRSTSIPSVVRTWSAGSALSPLPAESLGFAPLDSDSTGGAGEGATDGVWLPPDAEMTVN